MKQNLTLKGDLYSSVNTSIQNESINFSKSGSVNNTTNVNQVYNINSLGSISDVDIPIYKGMNESEFELATEWGGFMNKQQHRNVKSNNANNIE